MKEDVLHFWFARRQESARKARLHGWRLWYTYCVENDYTVDTMIDPDCNPVMMIADFMIAMDRLGVKDYRIREARTAVQELFEFVQQPKYASLVASSLLKSISTALSSKVNRAAKYHDIWPLGVLLRYIRNGAPAEQLVWKDLMARSAALFMIFIPCRTIAMIRMDCARARWKKAERVLIVPAKEKMD